MDHEFARPARVWYVLMGVLLLAMVAADLLLPLSMTEEQLMVGGMLLFGAASMWLLA